jgi:hypothetical protein
MADPHCGIWRVIALAAIGACLCACGAKSPGNADTSTTSAMIMTDTRTRPAASLPDEQAFREIEWREMLPKDAIAPARPPLVGISGMKGIGVVDADEQGDGIDHSSPLRVQQFGSFQTVATLAGARVALSGYVVPLESDDEGRMTEFLFVPFFGACIHVPPPPPNQVVHVKLAQPIAMPELWNAYVLRGSLRTSKFDADVASAAYSMSDATLLLKPAKG